MILLFMMFLFVCTITFAALNLQLPKQEDEVLKECWHQKYRQISIVGIFFGIIFVVCMYKNVNSYTYVICVLTYLVLMKKIFTKLQISMKKSHYICAAIMILAALSGALTNAWQLHMLNHMLIFMVLLVFLLISYVDMQEKDLTQWFRYLILLGWEALVASFAGISHLKQWRTGSQQKSNNIKYIGIGLLCGLPLVGIVLLLLISADRVFADLFMGLVQLKWFGQGCMIVFVFLLASCGFYGLAYGGMQVSFRNIPKQEKKGEPVVAITISAMVAVLYMLFCFVQIRYLFLGGVWELPEKYTYAEYARQGFFQLLFVSALNYIMVLVGKYKFKESKVLKSLLLVISVCTYVMMASSFYRMLLYVKVYHLTFLRIVVLYFLVGLAVLFALLIGALYCKKVNLLKTTALTIVVFYLFFSFAKPDYWVAYYNSMQPELGTYDWIEMTENLSLDAAFVLWNWTPEEEEEEDGFYEDAREEYQKTIESQYKKINLRRFNLSVYLAGKAVKNSK